MHDGSGSERCSVFALPYGLMPDLPKRRLEQKNFGATWLSAENITTILTESSWDSPAGDWDATVLRVVQSRRL